MQEVSKIVNNIYKNQNVEYVKMVNNHHLIDYYVMLVQLINVQYISLKECVKHVRQDIKMYQVNV